MVDDSSFIEFRFVNPETVEVETEGFKGPACEKVMNRVIKDMGEKVASGFTEDYFEEPDGTQNAQEGRNG